MGRRCSVCQHPARKTIEAAVHAGASLAEAAALYKPLTKSSLGRHMTEHVASIGCQAVPDPATLIPPPAAMRVRERPGSLVQPVSLNPPTPTGTVVPFRALAPALTAPEIASREEATPRMVAILLYHGYSLAEIAKRFDLVEKSMSALLSDVEDGYMLQATGSSSIVIIGKLLFKAEYAIAELEGDYQDAKRQGRNRDARECRRLIFAERRELREMLREYGITRPLDPAELDGKSKRDMDDIHTAVMNSINGVFDQTTATPVARTRLIG